MFVLIFFCKQKTAYEIRISDGSSDVCSSDLLRTYPWRLCRRTHFCWIFTTPIPLQPMAGGFPSGSPRRSSKRRALSIGDTALRDRRSEEHTSELQSLMRISYAVFCLKKKKKTNTQEQTITTNTRYHNYT